jgi:pimeloyl-ACP methyl ester carboxylesterase
MRSWQEGIFFLFFSVFAISFSVSTLADEDTATMQTDPDVDMGVEESTPISPKAEEAQVEQTELPGALDVEPAAFSETSAEGAVSASQAPRPVAAMEPIPSASVPSGLVEVGGFKYPVYLFVPKDYKLDRTYAMIMIAPAEFAVAQEQIEYLTGLAQRKSIFLLAPYVLWPKSGTTPYQLDDWFLSVKKDIAERFPINKKRIYLLGKGSGAQYASYLAVKYPQAFSAVTLLEEAWDGPFSQLVHPQSAAANQAPFYVALKADGDAELRNQRWFDDFQKKGYPVHLAEYQNNDQLDTLEFKKNFFEWMEETSQNWALSVAQGEKGWKGKFKKGVKDFFAV